MLLAAFTTHIYRHHARGIYYSLSLSGLLTVNSERVLYGIEITGTDNTRRSLSFAPSDHDHQLQPFRVSQGDDKVPVLLEHCSQCSQSVNSVSVSQSYFFAIRNISFDFLFFHITLTINRAKVVQKVRLYLYAQVCWLLVASCWLLRTDLPS